MKVIITRSTIADGRHFDASKTPVEVSAYSARQLFIAGKAVPAPDMPPEPDNREKEIKPAKRGRKPKKKA